MMLSDVRRPPSKHDALSQKRRRSGAPRWHAGYSYALHLKPGELCQSGNEKVCCDQHSIAVTTAVQRIPHDVDQMRALVRRSRKPEQCLEHVVRVAPNGALPRGGVATVATGRLDHGVDQRIDAT